MISTRSPKMQVLAAIMRPGRRPTLRDLEEEVGVDNSHVYTLVRELARDGLVTWEKKKSRTLMPLVRFIPVEDL